MKTLVLTALCFSVSLAFSIENAPKADCTIELDLTSQWPDWPPIMTDTNDDPLRPSGTFTDDDRTITIGSGEVVRLSCTGRSFEAFSDEFATATCEGSQSFSVSSPNNGNLGSYNFINLGCTSEPRDDTHENGLKCGPFNEGTQVELGYPMENQFEDSITVCFDESGSRAIMAGHILYKEIVARDTGNDRPSFRNDGYFDFDVDNAYSKAEQLITITELVGSESLANQYVRPSEEIYLARGHLSPNADFIYNTFQDATFFFVNVAPQWQCFNGGNWARSEDGVRDFVEDRQNDLVVYTGTHGILQLDDVNNNKVNIYLHPDGQEQLPVPLYYWKVVVDEAANSGVALVGVNNPHLSSGDISAHKVCSEISNHPMLSHVSNPNDIKKGIIYACRVEDVQAVFEEVPDLGSLGLLQ